MGEVSVSQQKGALAFVRAFAMGEGKQGARNERMACACEELETGSQKSSPWIVWRCTGCEGAHEGRISSNRSSSGPPGRLEKPTRISKPET